MEGKTALVVDDEVDRGSSLMGAIDVLQQQGVREVVGCCTHAVLSGPAVERLRGAQLTRLLTTDTIRLDPSK